MASPKQCILIVEDHAFVRESLARAFMASAAVVVRDVEPAQQKGAPTSTADLILAPTNQVQPPASRPELPSAAADQAQTEDGAHTANEIPTDKLGFLADRRFVLVGPSSPDHGVAGSYHRGVYWPINQPPLLQ